MVGAKTVLGLAFLAVASVCLADDEAAKCLAKSMQRAFPVNITAVILQRDPNSPDSFQRVNVQRSADGQMRCTILQPLRYQGFTLVDDGDRLETYLPDDNLILDQESPGKALCEVDQRLRLAKKNYSFRMSPSDPIAGRTTICVIASPKFGELDIRKYYLDAATCYPLRLETYGSGREITVSYDTKLIEFPKTLDRNLFKLSVVGARCVTYNRRTKIVSAKQAQAVVGFVPLVPRELPLGFQAQEVQFSDGADSKSIVVRLSDGLARATVYESSAETPMKSVENSTTRVQGNVRLMLVSDLPERIRQQLLNAFIEDSGPESGSAERVYGLFLVPSERGLQASLELSRTVSAFPGLERPRSDVQIGAFGALSRNATAS